ncbi:MAG: metallophosphoesterase family protein [Rubricoccaceae bacterium]|nr:metallophosphoesterase family protein [Rubricoccaceae bacterium]
MSITAIGDIHGCRKTLELLLERLDARPEDHLLFVGDYVDRGPDSYGVIELLIELERQGAEGVGPQCTFLRGNHDQMMLDAIDYPDDREIQELWRINGGGPTTASYQVNDALPYLEEHVEFLRRTELLHETNKFVFVHAGLNPDATIEQNVTFFDPQIALWTRAHLSSDLGLWEKTVVCGHTPRPQPINKERLINIDTGAVYAHIPGMGRLTAVRLPQREFVDVPFVG